MTDERLTRFMVSEFFDQMIKYSTELSSDKIIKDIQSFKLTLLKYILESKLQLTLLKDNFDHKERYKSRYDTSDMKLNLITERMSYIKKTISYDTTEKCVQLIDTLFELYNPSEENEKYIQLYLFIFTLISVLVALTYELISYFIKILVNKDEQLQTFLCSLLSNWKEKTNDLESIKYATTKLKDYIIVTKRQLCKTIDSINLTQEDIISQMNIDDLELYIVQIYQNYCNLEIILLGQR
ncbi:unnamed protein product [Didymodactylos carnosus]|uniref:Uncharacterized protein n=1 Tax=Didymodactylos carnosus TaxID=1234261 RepID=A0A814SZS0_9BILA|nr:unnamed protein product [Didymodactylos carnosus]CAF3916736.1 unnamed protein product [Didymodactylos carnosus]